VDWVYDDGGRSKYFKGETGDCVCRAIAIATEQDYKQTYRDLAELNKKRYGKKSARNGVHRDDIKQYLASLGWIWKPTMGIGTGCRVHLRKDELPSGRIVCSLSRHIVAVVDGVVHDTYDSTRDGERCVYGYWYKPIARRQNPKPRISEDEFEERVRAYMDDFEGGLMSYIEFGRLCRDAAKDLSGR